VLLPPAISVTPALLFTPSAMVLAQAIPATPIITALVHRAIEEPWEEYVGALREREHPGCNQEHYRPAESAAPTAGTAHIEAELRLTPAIPRRFGR
jgi:hypothetical protein